MAMKCYIDGACYYQSVARYGMPSESTAINGFLTVVRPEIGGKDFLGLTI